MHRLFYLNFEIEFLSEFRKIGICGTVKNRKGLSDLKVTLNKGEIAIVYNMIWSVIKLQDKNGVYIIITVYEI